MKEKWESEKMIWCDTHKTSFLCHKILTYTKVFFPNF